MHGGGGVNPAEVGTLSLEFHSLARATKRPEFDAGPDDVRRRMAATVTLLNSSLVPLSLKSSGGAHPTGRVSLGAMGDSYYEYLAKTAILDPRLRPTAGAMFKAALLEIEQQLLVPREHGRTFLAEASMNGRRGRPAGGASAAGAPRAPSDKPLFSKILKMDHLACFLPGTIAVALHHGVVPRGEGHEEVAEGILKTCIDMYRMTPSGIAPEILSLGPGNTPEVRRNDRHNLLRPETAESLYFVGLLTGKPRYRRAAWDMFAAFRAGSRASDGACT